MTISTSNIDSEGFIVNTSGARYLFAVSGNPGSAIGYGVKVDTSGNPSISQAPITGNYELNYVLANDSNYAELNNSLVIIQGTGKQWVMQIAAL